MAKELPSLGELEICVLQLIWREQPCTERHIWDLVCQQRDVARTTVLKTMQRLEAKGVLVRVAAKGPVQFRAAIEPERLLPTLVDHFVERTLGGSYGPLVAFLADNGNLSARDLTALRAIARKLDSGAAD
ncbi:MAG: BlaI/MecI/CopY family transcriptional regulator [Planctomycetia bacterium]|nr:BlaI/MecI/CopY family transcriptional regulator [Planctomycetia bacterium]